MMVEWLCVPFAGARAMTFQSENWENQQITAIPTVAQDGNRKAEPIAALARDVGVNTRGIYVKVLKEMKAKRSRYPVAVPEPKCDLGIRVDMFVTSAIIYGV